MHNIPKIFTYTIYREPTDQELIEVNECNLTSDEIYNGFSYTLIGKGILSLRTKNMIVEAITRLCLMFPENSEYRTALGKAHIMVSPFSITESFNPSQINNSNGTTKLLIKMLIREHLGY